MQQNIQPTDDQVDDFVKKFSAEMQSMFLTILSKNNDEANELRIPFPVVMYFAADALASSCYEIIKASSGTRDIVNPQAFNETEQEIVEMLKLQIDSGWEARMVFFCDQEQLNASTKIDADGLLDKPH